MALRLFRRGDGAGDRDSSAWLLVQADLSVRIAHSVRGKGQA